jgi:hypothetical protein
MQRNITLGGTAIRRGRIAPERVTWPWSHSGVAVQWGSVPGGNLRKRAGMNAGESAVPQRRKWPCPWRADRRARHGGVTGKSGEPPRSRRSASFQVSRHPHTGSSKLVLDQAMLCLSYGLRRRHGASTNTQIRQRTWVVPGVDLFAGHAVTGAGPARVASEIPESPVVALKTSRSPCRPSAWDRVGSQIKQNLELVAGRRRFPAHGSSVRVFLVAFWILLGLERQVRSCPVQRGNFRRSDLHQTARQRRDVGGACATSPVG